MSKPLMYAEYAFMFDPAETFQELYEFEHILDEFLESRGLEAVKINPVTIGSKGIIYIKKMDMLDKMEEKEEEDKKMKYDPNTSKVKLNVKLKR